jgi:hypothetical protein
LALQVQPGWEVPKPEVTVLSLSDLDDLFGGFDWTIVSDTEVKNPLSLGFVSPKIMNVCLCEGANRHETERLIVQGKK